MLRWKYIIPRIVMVCFVCIGGWLALNPLLRWSLIRAGESVNGAKVEIGGLRTEVIRTKLRLSNLAVANSSTPLENLFEAKTAVLDIDAGALLRRRLVISEGKIEGIRLDTTRQSSGALPGAKDAEEKAGPSLSERATEFGGKWFENTAQSIGEKVENDLESVRLARSLMQRWPADYRQLEADVRTVRQNGKRVVAFVKQTKESPVQPLEHYRQLFAAIEQLTSNTRDVQQRCERLGNQMRLDQAAINQAKQRDWEYIQRHTRIPQLDAEDLTNYLLGPELGDRLSQLIQFVKWGRNQLPSDSGEADRVTTRGWDVALPGVDQRPDLLIQKLLLDGTGSIDGKPFEFAGVAHGITNHPSVYGQPTAVEIHTTGSVEMLVRANLDHTGATPSDRIQIECPAISQPARTLGTPSRLALQIAPSAAALRVDVTLTGDQLGGIVQFHQPTASIRPTVSKELGGQIVADRLSTVVSGLQAIEAAVRVGGTLDRPSWKINSDLGPQLASGINSAVRDEIEHRQEELLTKANEEVDAQVASLQQELLAKQQGLLDELNLGNEELAFVKDQLAGFNLGDRISGRLTGENGLLNKILQR